jgi:hypothetical protein
MSIPVYESALFGPITSASEVEEAVEKTLKFWYPTYLAEMERRLGLRKGIMTVPQNYTNRNSFDTVEGEKTPKIVVLAPGLETAPMKTAQSYRAVWRVGVGIATGAKTERDCNRMVKAYAAATRAIMAHKPQTIANNGLPGLNEVTWLAEMYDDLDIQNQHRLYKAASLYFAVDINAVIARRGGPLVPDLQPDDLLDVEDVDVDVLKVPILEDMPEGG